MRSLVKLNAENTVKKFEEIVTQDNQGIYPEICLTDRGF